MPDAHVGIGARVGSVIPTRSAVIEGTPEFTAYIADMLWAQDYAGQPGGGPPHPAPGPQLQGT